MVMRYLFVAAGVLLVWGSLGFHFVADSDPMDRMVTIIVGIAVTVLAVLVCRGPLLGKSRGPDVGGADGDLNHYDSHDSHSHGGDNGDGHGGSDAGDGDGGH